MKRLTFQVKFQRKNSEHWVNVVLYKTTADMRRTLTLKGHKDSSDTEAACWQANKPGKDYCVAEIHLPQDRLTLSAIVHEASHAAHHRAILVGLSPTHDEFQEWVANGTGNLVDAILAHLDHTRIPVRYECVPKRRVI